MACTLNISLPEPLKIYVDAQTEAGNFGTPSQYIRELILDDRDRRRHHLEEHLTDALLLEAEAIPISDQDWQDGNIVAALEAHLEKQA